jgi:hypothetical protein
MVGVVHCALTGKDTAITAVRTKTSFDNRAGRIALLAISLAFGQRQETIVLTGRTQELRTSGSYHGVRRTEILSMLRQTGNGKTCLTLLAHLSHHCNALRAAMRFDTGNQGSSFKESMRDSKLQVSGVLAALKW